MEADRQRRGGIWFRGRLLAMLPMVVVRWAAVKHGARTPLALCAVYAVHCDACLQCWLGQWPMGIGAAECCGPTRACGML